MKGFIIYFSKDFNSFYSKNLSIFIGIGFNIIKYYNKINEKIKGFIKNIKYENIYFDDNYFINNFNYVNISGFNKDFKDSFNIKYINFKDSYVSLYYMEDYIIRFVIDFIIAFINV